MRILVTGAGGFVGNALATLAAMRGHDVVGTCRRVPLQTNDRRFQTLALDLHCLDAVVQTLADCRPQVIVHAAWSGVSARHRLASGCSLADVAATAALVEAGAEHGLERFVGIGSQAEYGAFDGPVAEDHALEPRTWYGSAKVAACFLARQQCLNSAISFAWARLFSAYGPGDKPNWLIPSVVADLCAGRRPRTTSGRQLWDYLYIDDVATALLALCETPQAVGIFNLGSGRASSVRSIVEQIRDWAAPGLDLVFGEVPHGADQIWHMEADVIKLSTATGWVPAVSLDEGLKRTVDAFRVATPLSA